MCLESSTVSILALGPDCVSLCVGPEVFKPRLRLASFVSRLSMLCRGGKARAVQPCLLVVLRKEKTVWARGKKHSRSGPTGQHSEKCWEIIVNPDVAGYTKTRNHRKTPKKTWWKPKEYYIPKYKESEGYVFTFSLPGRGLAPDRRQRVFNRGALQFCGGLCVCAGGLDIIKLTKIPLIYSVSRINLGGLGALIGGLSQPKPPRGDGTGSHACPPSITPLKKRCWSWRLNHAPVSEDAVVTIWLMLVTRRNSESALIQRHLTDINLF